MPCLDDNQIAALVDGALTAAEQERAQEHLALCPVCRAVALSVGDAGSAGASGLSRGSTIARYTLLYRVGRGAMGEVWAAYDPELDRRIALKLIRQGLPDHAELATRLRREARAMARVNHPNVVAVYDVGIDRGHVFIAMEFVAGITLRQFLRESRTWQEILALFAAALRGIAAAHAAGVIHRDFKPENVLVGTDRRVRVTDFGVASCGAGEPVKGRGTVASSLAGTPRYMAPEQYAGGLIDHRADQFAVAVALWESLCGEHPFSGGDAEALRHAVTQGPLRSPARSLAPRHVHDVLVRALSIDPEARYPSAQAFLQALEHDPWRRRKRWGLALGAAAAIAALATGAVWLAESLDPCGHAADPIAKLWNPGVRDSLQRRFLATGLPYAGVSFGSFSARLDQYVATWSRMRVEACVDTRKLGSRSAELLDRRMMCLDSWLLSVRGLLEQLDTAPWGDVTAQAVVRERVDRAAQALEGMPPLSRCADEEALLAIVPPPADETAARRIEGLEAKVAQASAARELGQYREALSVAQDAVREAETVTYPPLTARALIERALISEKLGEFARAEGDLLAATLHAARAHDDWTAARAWTWLIVLVGDRQGRVDEGLALAGAADAALLRAGDPGDLRALWHNWVALLLLAKRNYDEAWKHAEAAAALQHNVDGTDVLATTRTLTVMGAIRSAQGRGNEALALVDEAVRIHEEKLGAEHPMTISASGNVASALSTLGRLEEALDRLELTLSRAERTFGPEHPYVEPILDNIASTCCDLGRFDEAVRASRRALAVNEKAHGPRHPNTLKARVRLAKILGNAEHIEESLAAFEAVLAEEKELGDAADLGELADIHNGMAVAFAGRGDMEAALDQSKQAVALGELAYGAESPDTGWFLVALASAQAEVGRIEEARQNCRRALAMTQQAVGDDDPQLSYHLTMMASIELAGKKPAAAIAPAERALAIQTATGSSGTFLAQTKLYLARALWESGKDRTRALALAQEAREALRAAGGRSPPIQRELEAFLAGKHLQ